jgi:hypothetical protein
MSHRSEAANKPRASDALLRAELSDLRALFQQAPGYMAVLRGDDLQAEMTDGEEVRSSKGLNIYAVIQGSLRPTAVNATSPRRGKRPWASRWTSRQRGECYANTVTAALRGRVWP